MQIYFRRDRSVRWIIIHSAIVLITMRLALAFFGDSTAVFMFFTWATCVSSAALFRHVCILARPQRFKLTIGDDRLELCTPFGTSRVDWADVTTIGVEKFFDRVRGMRLYFDGATSTRKSHWTGFKSFALRCDQFDIEADRLVEAIGSAINTVRRTHHCQPVTISRTWSLEPFYAAVGIVLTLMTFSRFAGNEQRRSERILRHEIGVPGLRAHDAVDKAQVDRLIKLYPRDPRVRLAHAEKLVDEGRLAEAVSELKALDAEPDVLRVFDDFYPNLEGEVMAIAAEALVKRGRVQAARETVGPVCKDLENRVFEKMRKLDLCHYS